MIDIPNNVAARDDVNMFWVNAWNGLHREYARLGFSVSFLCVRRCPDDSNLMQMTGTILCPCGGSEFLQVRVPFAECRDELSDALVDEIMRLTASQEHLEQDVKNGTLPSYALEFAVYKPAPDGHTRIFQKLFEVKHD